MLSSHHETLAHSFGKASSSYDHNSHVQQVAARHLASYLPASTPATILEIGCGTGHLTSHLCSRYPDAQITVTDISQSMLKQCQAKYGHYPNLHFTLMNGETLDPSIHYDLIVSSMVVQWFQEPLIGLNQLRQLLTPEGSLYYATLGKQSFWQWSACLAALELPSGLVSIPEWPNQLHDEMIAVKYENAYDFLRSLKAIGAHQPRFDYRPLTSARLKTLCRYYDQHYNGQIDWHLVYGKMTSPT